MERLSERFQNGGKLYNYNFENEKQSGGEIKEKLSPKNENWKKKYLEIKLEKDNLLKENKKLKQKIKKLESKS